VAEWWDMQAAGVRYREYAPCEALRGWVRALFSFSEPVEEPSRRAILVEVQFGPGERLCAPGFADAHSCIVFDFDKQYGPDGTWHPSSLLPRADLIGPMTFPGPLSVPVRAEGIGAYFCAGAVVPGAPAAELENRVFGLEDIWGRTGRQLAEDLWGARSEGARLDRLESALLERVAAARPARGESRDLSRMAAWIVENAGDVPVERLAEAAGLSRRHFTRVFRDTTGVSPKVYCQLARFRSALAHVGRGKSLGWAQVALQCGYADQSHMIAEFRRFSGLTPEALAQGRWFHPFLEGTARRQHGHRSFP
jgi:AraC-like DNA-binding protein